MHQYGIFFQRNCKGKRKAFMRKNPSWFSSFKCVRPSNDNSINFSGSLIINHGDVDIGKN